jgi:hypothetical protein
MNTCRRPDAESHLKLEGLDPRDIMDEQFLFSVHLPLRGFLFLISGMGTQVKLTPYLGQDRQRNEFWCLHVGASQSCKRPVVLCQEYSWVCFHLRLLGADLCIVGRPAHLQ